MKKILNLLKNAIKAIALLFALAVCTETAFAQANATYVIINPSGGRSSTNDLAVVVWPAGKFNIYYKGYRQSYGKDGSSPDGSDAFNPDNPSSNGLSRSPNVSFGFTNTSGNDFRAASYEHCNISPQQGSGTAGDPYHVVMTGNVTSPRTGYKYNVSITVKYIAGTKHILADVIVRTPVNVNISAQEKIHLYFDEDTFMGNDDNGWSFTKNSGPQNTVGIYRTSSTCRGNTTPQGVPRIDQMSYAYKAVGITSHRAIWPTGERMKKVGNTANLEAHDIPTSCNDAAFAIHMDIGTATSQGQSFAKQVMIGLGDDQNSFDNINIVNPNPASSSVVNVEFISATSGEAERNAGAEYSPSSIKVRVWGGTLGTQQSVGVKITGGSAVNGTDYTYQNAFIIPAGNYGTSTEITLNDIKIKGNNAPQSDRTIEILIESPCNDLIDETPGKNTHTFTIIDDDATMNAITNKTFCNGAEASITMSGNDFNSTPYSGYKWTSDNSSTGLSSNATPAASPMTFTATNNGSNAITSNVTVTPVRTVGGVQVDCKPVTFTLTVNPAPTINQPANITQCAGTQVPAINFSGSGITGQVQWSVTSGNAASIGMSSSSGQGSIPAFTATGSGEVTVTLEAPGSACAAATKTFTVKINATPVITSHTAAICSGGTFSVTPADGSGNTVSSGTAYSWSAPSVQGISGAAAGSNQQSISGTLTNSTNAPVNVTYTVTPKSGNCAGANFNVTVTVNPKPAIQNLPATTVCSGVPFSVTPADGSGNTVPSGTSYSWSAPSVQGISGAAAGSNQQNISGTLTNSTNAPVNVTYTVTPKSGNCTGANFNVTVTVNPVAGVIAAQTATVCSGGTFSVTPANGNGNTVPSGTSYSWSAPSVQGISGAAAGSNQQNISGTLTNSTNAPINVTYIVTPKSGNCTGANFNVTVTVNPVAWIADKSFNAASGSPFEYTPADGSDGIVPSGTTYTWTVSVPNAAITGATGGNGSKISGGTLTNTSGTPESITYTVLPVTNNCQGASFTITVTVKAGTVIRDTAITVCSGVAFEFAPADGNGNMIPAGTKYSWAAPAAANITGATAGTDENKITGTLTNTSGTKKAIVYNVSTGGARFNLTVNVYPPFTAGAIEAYGEKVCASHAPAVTAGSSAAAAGGANKISYRWKVDGSVIAGATSATYLPALADIDYAKMPKEYMFVREAVDSCSAAWTASANTWTVRVLPQSLMNYPDVRAFVCPAPAQPVNLSQFIDTTEIVSLAWQKSGNSADITADGIINPADFGDIKTHTFTYTVSNGCVNSLKRKFYLQLILPTSNRFDTRRDTITVCHANAHALQVNQIFGIAAAGTYSWDNSNPDIGKYIRQITAGHHAGALVFNAAAAYLQQGLLQETTYRGKTVKCIKFTYTTSQSTCLAGKAYDTVIILTDSLI